MAEEKKTAAKAKKGLSGWVIAVIVVLALALVGGGVFLVRYIQNQAELKMMTEAVEVDTFYPGITIDGVDVGGRTYDDVLAEMLAREEPMKESMFITLTCGVEELELTAEDLGVSFNTEEVVQQAWNVNRTGTLQERYAKTLELAEKGEAFTIQSTVAPDGVKDKVTKFVEARYVAPIDAAMASFDPAAEEKFTFTDAVDGLEGDADKVFADVKAAVEGGTFGADIEVALTPVKAEVQKDDLANDVVLIAEYVTTATGGSARVGNVRLASSAINGAVVMPGEEFSVNGATGPRTYAKGYRPAPAIINGGAEMEDQIGGGVCQVSSTLYVALVKSDLEITERRNHSRVSGYIPVSMDATIDYPGLDLKFKNNKDKPVYLVMYVDDNNRVHAEVYGPALADGMYITVTSSVTGYISPADPKEEIDTTKEPGYKEEVIAPRTGVRAVAYKNYYDKNGELIKTEQLNSSTYPAVQGSYILGPEASPSPDVSPDPGTEPTPAP